MQVCEPFTEDEIRSNADSLKEDLLWMPDNIITFKPNDMFKSDEAKNGVTNIVLFLRMRQT